MANSPAEKADIQVGDVIVRLNGKNVNNAVDVKNMIGDLRTGTDVHMTTLRAGRSRDVTVTISSPDSNKPVAVQAKGNKQNNTNQPYWEKSIR